MSGNSKKLKLKQKKENWYTVKQKNVISVKKLKIEKSISEFENKDLVSCYTEEAWEYINDDESF